MHVIGAGFGRTGTESLSKALNMLGLGPTHHMYEVIGNDAQKQAWRAVANGARPDWAKLYLGYSSAVDWPTAYYWRELMDVFPAAKIVLTTRNPDRWWESFSNTILMAIRKTDDPDALNRRLIAEGVFGGKADDADHAKAIYAAHNADVRATVPRDRLIEMHLGAGWAPLCDGLGLPVPEAPFPSGNTSADFTADGSET